MERERERMLLELLGTFERWGTFALVTNKLEMSLKESKLKGNIPESRIVCLCCLTMNETSIEQV